MRDHFGLFHHTRVETKNELLRDYISTLKKSLILSLLRLIKILTESNVDINTLVNIHNISSLKLEV